MKFLFKISSLIVLAYSSAYAMEESVKTSGMLNLLNDTGSTVEISFEELKLRPDGLKDVIQRKQELKKGENYKLPLTDVKNVNLSFRTTRLGKKFFEVPIKKIAQEVRSGTGTLVLKAGGWLGSDIIIDLDKNLKIIESPQTRNATEHAVENELQEIIIRNDTLGNMFIKDKQLHEVEAQKTLKGETVITPSIEYESGKWISENQTASYPLRKVIRTEPLTTFRLISLAIAPGYKTDEEMRQGWEKVTNWIELPLDRIKRLGAGHKSITVPIIKESGLLTKMLKVDLDHVAFT